MNELRGAMYRLQWIVPILLGVWWFLAPGSGTGGWATVLMIIVAPIVVAFCLVPSIVAFSVRRNRETSKVGARYAVAAILLWVLLAVPPATIEGADDMRAYPSILEGMGLPGTAMSPIAMSFLLAALIAWVACLVSASDPSGSLRRSPDAADPAELESAIAPTAADGPAQAAGERDPSAMAKSSMPTLTIAPEEEGPPRKSQRRRGVTALVLAVGAIAAHVLLSWVGYAILYNPDLNTYYAAVSVLRLALMVGFSGSAVVIAIGVLRRTEAREPGRAAATAGLALGALALLPSLAMALIALSLAFH